MDYEELKEVFSLMDDWEERYKIIIDLGRAMPEMDSNLKTEASKVEGCTSQVWIVPVRTQENHFDFIGDSDALIVRGLIAVLRLIYGGKTSAQIKEINIEQEFASLGLMEHLSPNRRNGFFAMVGRLQEMALNSNS